MIHNFTSSLTTLDDDDGDDDDEEEEEEEKDGVDVLLKWVSSERGTEKTEWRRRTGRLNGRAGMDDIKGESVNMKMCFDKKKLSLDKEIGQRYICVLLCI